MYRLLVALLITISSILPVLAGEGYVVNTNGNAQNIASRKKLIEEVLRADSMRFGYNALLILIDANQVEPRGKMQGRSITLSATVLRDGEFLKLLVHELGHYTDIYDLVAV